MRNTPKSLNEELNRMKRLMSFEVDENSHDVLSENFVKKSTISEQVDLDAPVEVTAQTKTYSEKQKETLKSLQKMDANNETIKSIMESGIGTYLGNLTKENFTAVWSIWPKLGSALSKRANIKNMFKYFKKAGTLEIKQGSNQALGGWKMKIPTVGDRVVYKKNGKFLVSESDKDFLEGFNKETLTRWANNKQPYLLGVASPTRNSNGILKFVITNGKNNVPDFYDNAKKSWPDPKQTNVKDANNMKGKSVDREFKRNYSADFWVGDFPKGEFLRDVDGGLDVLKVLEKQIDWEKLPQCSSGGKIIEIPYLIYLGIDPDLNDNILLGYNGLGKKTKKTFKLCGEEKDTTTDPIEVDDYVGGKSELDFVTGSHIDEKTPGSIDNWVGEEIENLKEYINGQLKDLGKGESVSLNMGPITLTSSASNSWNGKTLDPVNLTTEKPAAVTDDASKNKNLAYDRGATMITKFTEKLKEAKNSGDFENVEFNDEMVIQWQVADTGGKTGSGEWVKVTVGGGGSGTKKTTKTTPGTNMELGFTKTSSVWYAYDESLSRKMTHPNNFGSKIINVLSSLGLTRTKSSVVNQAKNHGYQDK